MDRSVSICEDQYISSRRVWQISSTYGRQKYFGVFSKLKNIIEADSDDENEMNNAALVTTSSEMRNVLKIDFKKNKMPAAVLTRQEHVPNGPHNSSRRGKITRITCYQKQQAKDEIASRSPESTPKGTKRRIERTKISIFSLSSEKEFENPQDCGTHTEIQKRTCRRGLRKNKAIREVPMVVSVNGDPYRAMITNFFIPDLNNHDVQELWFQQDGATCHTARATIDLLKDTIGKRLISRFGPVNGPVRSCDLTPLDYFLWGYVKSLVYADKPQTLDHF
ncbi:uncharacterized protein TNCV_4696211 [Trichonephila clavipes]|nr:uncharacterized protein TNCV_4696211 [Trichonephila clavipes]